MLSDLATDSYTTERNVNLITGILGNVSGSQWLAETIVNISGTAGHSNGVEHIVADISVTPSFALGASSGLATMYSMEMPSPMPWSS